MKARCPNCWTVFRVTREHLSARGGKVRCGQCQEIFNALGNLLDEGAAGFPVLLDPKELEGLESLQEFPLPEDGRPDALKTPEAGAPEKTRTEPLPETAPDEPLDFSPLEGLDELAALDAVAVSEDSDVLHVPNLPDIPDIPDLPNVPDETKGRLELLEAPEILKSPEPEEIPEIAVPEELLPPLPTHVPEAEIQVETVGAPDLASFAMEPEPEPEPRPETETNSLARAETVAPDAPTSARPMRKARDADHAAEIASPREIAGVLADVKWAESFLSGSFGHSDGMERRFKVAAILLGVVLLFQVLGRFRGEIALAAPLLKPPLELVSRAFGARVPLPRHIEMINLEASDLQSDPERDLLVLNALLRNRANYGQAYPALEFLLTDAHDKVVVRRVFDPSEYLPLKISPHQAFAANSDISIRLWVEARDVKAVGYRLYVAYP
ncbi:MAG: zinc-ribbon domain-containing protein [Candidatus Accumulibacter sp.]|jgi:predicted Zn finger-like uncharacterized protein|nr:zinc-ribbon domain-containing protein [Accumulibacter sp.]